MTDDDSILRQCVALPASGWLALSAGSARGPRPRNEDNFLTVTPNGRAWHLDRERLVERSAPDWPADGRFLRMAVADGMGGHSGGLECAQAVMENLLTRPPVRSPEEARDHVMDIHRHVLARTGLGHSGCCLLWAEIDLLGLTAVIVHVGDCRAYFSHRGIEYKVTNDHRVSEFAYRDREMSLAEYRSITARKSNRLAQAVGYGSHQAFNRQETSLNDGLRIDLADHLPNRRVAHADALRIALRPGDSLALVSDGTLLGPDGGFEATAETLPDLIRNLGHNTAARDNATAIVIRVMEGPPPGGATGLVHNEK